MPTKYNSPVTLNLVRYIEIWLSGCVCSEAVVCISVRGIINGGSSSSSNNDHKSDFLILLFIARMRVPNRGYFCDISICCEHFSKWCEMGANQIHPHVCSIPVRNWNINHKCILTAQIFINWLLMGILLNRNVTDNVSCGGSSNWPTAVLIIILCWFAHTWSEWICRQSIEIVVAVRSFCDTFFS